MKLTVPKTKDFYAGLLFVGIGIVALAIASRYRFGTAASMGSGYFPMVLAGGLVALGAVIALNGLIGSGETIAGGFVLRPFLILLAVVAFGLTVEPLGLGGAALLLVLLGCLASHGFRLVEIVLLTAGLTAAAIVVFVFGLGLPFRLWPT